MCTRCLFDVSDVKDNGLMNPSLLSLIDEEPEAKTLKRFSPYATSASNPSGELEYADAREFSIAFRDVSGEQRTFKFTLMPAVDDGNETTHIPEIKPGILKKTSMHMKRFTVPGSSPIFQMIGVRETILQCVGLMVGNESFDEDSEDQSINDIYSKSSQMNAYKAALEFDGEIVQKGYACGLTIASGGDGSNDETLVIRHNCLVQNFRYFITRSDRVWYSLELVVLDYTPGGSKYPIVETPQQATDEEDSVSGDEDEEGGNEEEDTESISNAAENAIAEGGE